MYYVEFLRVFRALRICAIVLAAVFLVAAAARVSLSPMLHQQFMRSFSPTAVRAVHRQPDGSVITTIDDHKKGVRVVQRTLGPMWDMTIYESPGHARRSGHNVHVRAGRSHAHSGGLLAMDETTLANGVHVYHMHNDRRYPLQMLVLIAGFVAALFATLVGCSLSRENNGHLELVWTKPSSRDAAALAMFGVDIAGILASFVLCALLVHLCIALFVGWPVVTFTGGHSLELLRALLFPIAWYALLQGATASMRRSGGMVCGLMWVGALVIPSLIAIPNDLLRAALKTLDTLNPLAYFGHFDLPGIGSPTLLPATLGANVLALSAIIILSVAASLLQWRRLEA